MMVIAISGMKVGTALNYFGSIRLRFVDALPE
jgi:hypothetical protein